MKLLKDLGAVVFGGLLISQPIKAEGLDINNAVLHCFMSGGECLAHTGIPFIDALFGPHPTPQHTDESFCQYYVPAWCGGPPGYPSAYDECLDAKKKFYKAAKQKLGQWNPPTGQKPGTHHHWTEQDYYEQIENNRKTSEPFFACTPRQAYIWLKNRCGHTNVYKTTRFERDDRPEVWARYKTETCKRRY